MAVTGFSVSFFWYQIGSASFLESFFATVAHNLEKRDWGSRFPVIMKQLYEGKVEPEQIDSAIAEVDEIRRELSAFSPDKVVWDYNDTSVLPPWGTQISEDITSLANYFVTSDGEDFLTILMHALERSKEMKLPVKIEVL